MDITITFDEVYALVGTNIPSLEPRPNFERIRNLRRHFENALQRLPCPQSVQHGWKGMVMAQNMYALLTTTPFRLPISPGDTPKYLRVALLGEQVDTSPLTRTEQATIDSTFARRKHYFLSMQNIKCQRRLQIVQFGRHSWLACGNDDGNDPRPTQFSIRKTHLRCPRRQRHDFS